MQKHPRARGRRLRSSVLHYEAASFAQQRRGTVARKEAAIVQARDLMQPHVIIMVDAADSMEHVMEVLDNERSIRVPVISDGELVGIIPRGDVLRDALSNRESRVLLLTPVRLNQAT